MVDFPAQFIPPPMDYNAHPFIWTIFAIFHLADLLLREIGSWILTLLSHRGILAALCFLSAAGAVTCSIDTIRQSWYMGITLFILVCGSCLAIGLHKRLIPFQETTKSYFRAWVFIVNAGGMVLVLVGFVKLTDLIEEHQGLEDLYAIGFFLFVFLGIATSLKFCAMEDLLGISDSTMALSIYLVSKLPETTLETYRTSVFVVATLLEMFKLAHLKLHVPARQPPLLPIVQTQPQLGCLLEPTFVHEADLHGHTKDIVGISLPQGPGRLYSVSRSGRLLIFCSNSRLLDSREELGAEVGSMMSQGKFVFLGLRDRIMFYKNDVNCTRDLLIKPQLPVGSRRNPVPIGQHNAFSVVVSTLINDCLGLVTAMAYANGMLFAGTSLGRISYWLYEYGRSNYHPRPFKYLATLPLSHDDEVTCFATRGRFLFSGSADRTIRAWDLTTLECTMTLREHTDTVTSLLCLDQYLFSSSLDGTVKVWASSEDGRWVVVTNHIEGQSVHALCGMLSVEGRPNLLCSNQRGTVSIYIYDQERFIKRGSLCSKSTIETLLLGSEGWLYSGGRSGKLRAWRCNDTF